MFSPKLKKRIFKALAQFNKKLLPSMTVKRLDPIQMNKPQKILLAWRYYVTCRALD
jgi:hypothetical protein